MLTKAQYEALLKTNNEPCSNSSKHDTASDKYEVGLVSIKNDDIGRPAKQQMMEAGIRKKRKAAKVFDNNDVSRLATEDSKTTKNSKKKSKAIKLSFDGEEG